MSETREGILEVFSVLSLAVRYPQYLSYTWKYSFNEMLFESQ